MMLPIVPQLYPTHMDIQFPIKPHYRRHICNPSTALHLFLPSHHRVFEVMLPSQSQPPSQQAEPENSCAGVAGDPFPPFPPPPSPPLSAVSRRNFTFGLASPSLVTSK